MGKEREIGSIIPGDGGRNVIKTEDGCMPYAVYVAKNNPDICGVWYKGCEVHHINRVVNDDRPENLVCLDVASHKRVHQMSIDAFYKGCYLGRFACVADAAKELNIPAMVIYSYIRNDRPMAPKWKSWRFTNKTVK